MMHILFLCHYFPPEVNAPASRTYENAKRWVAAGHRVTVLTCVPNHPNGMVYPGYKNRTAQWDEKDGIRVLRIKTYIGPNKGFFRRTANYISYMVSAACLCRRVRDVDVVVSTSPQFFCGLAGFFVSRRHNCPWVLEIRDLWPESIKAVGAVRQDWIIRFFEGVETFMYRTADHIVSLTRAFRTHITARGVPLAAVSMVTNGADLNRFTPISRDKSGPAAPGLKDKFVVSFIGTHGMAHGLDTVLDAARELKSHSDILFLLVGDGAERERLEQKRMEMGLDNVLMLPQQEKRKVPLFIAASDACMVLLRKSELFKTVIPSKIFEAMAMERPVILGVEGESRQIIETAGCGICIEPENARELSRAVLDLLSDPAMGRLLGRRGRQCVKILYNRDALASTYLGILKKVSRRCKI